MMLLVMVTIPIVKNVQKVNIKMKLVKKELVQDTKCAKHVKQVHLLINNAEVARYVLLVCIPQ